MARLTPFVIAMAAALSLSGCVMPGKIPLLVADADGYIAISPCGDPIVSIEVRKSLSATSTEPYWKAEAHLEAAATQVRLFSVTPGYASTSVVGALQPGAEYLVEINDVTGASGFVGGELKAGRGQWQNDRFDVADLAVEQAKVAGMVCPR